MLPSSVSDDSGAIVVSVVDYRAISMSSPHYLRFSSIRGENEPDTHLKKQVGTGGKVGLGTAGPALRRDSQRRDHRVIEILVFPIRQLLSWLLSGCINSENRHGSVGFA